MTTEFIEFEIDDYMNKCPDVIAEYGKSYFMGMAVWDEEIVFIKSKGTRMTRI